MFWGVKVGSKEIKFQPAYDLHLSTACLDADAKQGRNVLQVNYGGETFSLCSLTLGGSEHANFDTIFEEGSEVSFKVIGGSSVSLTGYYVDSMGGEVDEEDDEDEEFIDGELPEGAEELDDEDEDEEEEDIDEEELEKQILAAKKAEINNKKRPTENGNTGNPEKKTKQETTPAKKDPLTKAAASPANNKKETTPAKKETPAKAAAAPAKPAAPQQKPAAKADKPVTLKNGLQYQDLVVGTGPTVVPGKKVSVKYIGKLLNGKTFDSSLNKPFDFKLGVGDVIKGWDVGVTGMKVGGKRKLFIPSNLAYGTRGAGRDIPPNADLTFEVEVVRAAQ
eukprot:gene4131-5169_t